MFRDNVSQKYSEIAITHQAIM